MITDPHAEQTNEYELDRQASEYLLNLRIERTDEDRRLWTLRMLMILETRSEDDIAAYMTEYYDTEMDCPAPDVILLVQHLNRMRAEKWGMGRETLTELALNQSVCPIHYVDYAMCFDDQDPSCEQVRFVHPTHDT